jgi:hypothetical protein
MRPLFSLCHATARLPDGSAAVHRAWIEAAKHPECVEYILAIDAADAHKDLHAFHVPVKVVVNIHHRTAVDAWNAAGAVASGLFLITVADDFFPIPEWDEAILRRMPDLSQPAVLHVGELEGDDALLYHSFLTQTYYKRLGCLFWPEYDGMYADNEFTDKAYRDGVVIDARDLKFNHRHPAYGTRAQDALGERHQAKWAYDLGREVYERRKAQGFPGYPVRG